MSARTRTTTATSNDVTTPAGFLAEYDAVVQELNATHHWCPDGMRYPYDYANDGINVIRRPSDRTPQADVIPDEYLSDAGKAWQAEQAAGKLAGYQSAAKAAILYGIRNDYLTTEDIEMACPRLGLPVPVRQTHGHLGSCSGYAYFQVPERLTNDQHMTLRQAFSDALTMALAAFTPALSPQPGADSFQISTSSDVNRHPEQSAWEFPQS